MPWSNSAVPIEREAESKHDDAAPPAKGLIIVVPRCDLDLVEFVDMLEYAESINIRELGRENEFDALCLENRNSLVTYEVGPNHYARWRNMGFRVVDAEYQTNPKRFTITSR